MICTASSIHDDDSMLHSITKKKFVYSKLVFARNKNGDLCKDLALKHNNKCIFKAIEAIMNETWSEYHQIARINAGATIKLINESKNEDVGIQNSENIAQNIRNFTTNKQNETSCKLMTQSRKRRLDIDDDSISYTKRRKLNGSCGAFVRTTPQTPNMSPSPLPPLPPISSLDNFCLDDSVSASSDNALSFLSLPTLCTLPSKSVQTNLLNHGKWIKTKVTLYYISVIVCVVRAVYCYLVIEWEPGIVWRIWQ